MLLWMAAIAVFASAVVFLALAARNRSHEMTMGGSAILVAAISIVTVIFVFL